MNQATSQQTAQTLPGFTVGGLTLTIIDFLYLAMLLFLAYQTVRSHQVLSRLEEPKYTFESRPKTINLILTVMILGFGVITFVLQKSYVTGVIMILLGLVFLYSSRNRVIVAKEGFFADNKYFTWGEVRRWAWDVEGGNLVIVTKTRGKKMERQVLQVGRVKMTEINERFRQFKLGKTPVIPGETDSTEPEPLEAPESLEDAVLDEAAVEENRFADQKTQQEAAEHRVGLKGTGKSHQKRRKK